MIVDANVLLGRWPFVPPQYDTVDGLLTLMDRAGIGMALATSLDSVFYYDYEIGNHEVGAACQAHPDRLAPLAVVNPNFASWRQHLGYCVDNYGCRGIKLHPDYHRYGLQDPGVGEVMAAAREWGLPVHVQTSLLDIRHHPGYCFVWEVPMLSVARAVQAYPDNTFVIAGAKHFGARLEELLGYAGASNFFAVVDGLGGPYDGIGELVGQMGSERLLYGSRLPLLYAEASRDMVEQSEISQEQKNAIFGLNARRLYGLR
jgi:uncharacterized protein